MDVSPYRYIIYIFIVRPNWGIHYQSSIRVFLKLRNNWDTDSETKEVLKTRSKISKPIFITLSCVECLLIVSLIRCQKSHCYSTVKKIERGLANFSQSFS